MKSINSYIIEKLRINKDSKLYKDPKLIAKYENLTMYFDEDMLKFLEEKLPDLEERYNAAYFYDSAYLTYNSRYKNPKLISVYDDGIIKNSNNVKMCKYSCYYGESHLGYYGSTIDKDILNKLGWLEKEYD